jgi:hypothetical protein
VAKGLKNKLSAGIDEIPDYVLKQCIQLLKKPSANIYNASLESGIFQDQLKITKVVPVYKKRGYKGRSKLQTNSAVICFFKSAKERGV